MVCDRECINNGRQRLNAHGETIRTKNLIPKNTWMYISKSRTIIVLTDVLCAISQIAWRPLKDSISKSKVCIEIVHRDSWKLNISPFIDIHTQAPSMETWNQLSREHLLKLLDTLGRKNKDWFDEDDKEIHYVLTKNIVVHRGHITQPTCLVKKTTFDALAEPHSANSEKCRTSGEITLHWGPIYVLISAITEASTRL